VTSLTDWTAGRIFGFLDLDGDLDLELDHVIASERVFDNNTNKQGRRLNVNVACSTNTLINSMLCCCIYGQIPMSLSMSAECCMTRLLT